MLMERNVKYQSAPSDVTFIGNTEKNKILSDRDKELRDISLQGRSFANYFILSLSTQRIRIEE